MANIIGKNSQKRVMFRKIQRTHRHTQYMVSLVLNNDKKVRLPKHIKGGFISHNIW